MKLSKTLGVVIVAAVVAVAFTGSATASRLHPLIGLCKAQELLLCAEANQAKLAGTLLLLQIGTGLLEGTINQKCIGGEFQMETGAMEDFGGTESKLLDKTTKLTFTGCEPCKKITATLPFTTNLKMTEELESGEGKWSVEGGGSAKFEECALGVNCKFGAKELKPEPLVEMTATEAIVNTNKAVLTREEGSEFFCGNSGKWNAKYKVELKLPTGTVHNVWPTLLATTASEGSTASRLHPLIGLCKAQELLLCAEANQVKLEGTLLLLQLGTGVLEGTINQKCTGGEFQMETGAMEDFGGTESKLLGKTTKLTFTGCEPCKKITATLPFTTNLKMTEELESGEGKWTLEASGSAKFEECSFGINCRFGTEKLTPEPLVEMTATEAIVNTNKAVLQFEEGSEFFCGKTGKWNAKYKVELKLPGGTIQKVWPTLLTTEIATPVGPHPLAGICKAPEPLSCAEANQAKLEGTLLLLQLGTGELEGVLNEKCTGGESEGEVGEMVEGPGAKESKLLGETTKLIFTGCEPCKRITATPPFTTSLKMTEELANGEGRWTLEGAGKAVFAECSFGSSCKFGAAELKPAPTIEMVGTEAILDMNKAELKREEGNEAFCGNSGKWNAKYKIELKLPTGTVHNVWPTLLTKCPAKAVEEGLC